ncbi:hypothetical protein CBL_11309 [Carabus blaptoides fortunei]
MHHRRLDALGVSQQVTGLFSSEAFESHLFTDAGSLGGRRKQLYSTKNVEMVEISDLITLVVERGTRDQLTFSSLRQLSIQWNRFATSSSCHNYRDFYNAVLELLTVTHAPHNGPQYYTNTINCRESNLSTDRSCEKLKRHT